MNTIQNNILNEMLHRFPELKKIKDDVNKAYLEYNSIKVNRYLFRTT